MDVFEDGSSLGDSSLDEIEDGSAGTDVDPNTYYTAITGPVES